MRKCPGAAVPIALNGVRRYRLAAEIMELGDSVRPHCRCGGFEADWASGALVPLGFVVRQGTVDLFVRRTCMNGQLRSKRFCGNCEIREPGRFRIIARGKNSSVHSRRKSTEQTGRSARGLRICLGWLRLLHAIVWDGIPKPGGPSSMKHNVPVFSAKPRPMRFEPRKRPVLQRLCIALWQTHAWAPTIKRGVAGTAERKLRPRTEGAPNHLPLLHQPFSARVGGYRDGKGRCRFRVRCRALSEISHPPSSVACLPWYYAAASPGRSSDSEDAGQFPTFLSCPLAFEAFPAAIRL